jgi:hypothetical protein
MDEKVFIEFFMIIIVLSIGFLLLTSVTPLLQSISKPQAAPLVEVVYSYCYYNATGGYYNWTGYLYEYDPGSVSIQRISLYGDGDISLVTITINDQVYNNGEVFYLENGLNNVTIIFTSNSVTTETEITYIIMFSTGYSLDGKTSVS